MLLHDSLSSHLLPSFPPSLPSTPSLFESVLLLLSLREMKDVLTQVIERKGGKERWVRALLLTRPVVVEAITTTWEGEEEEEEEEEEEKGEGKGGREGGEEMAKFFAVIFPRGHEEAIQKHLFEGKEAFAREACARVVGL